MADFPRSLFAVLLLSLPVFALDSARIPPTIPRGEDFHRNGRPVRFWGFDIHTPKNHVMAEAMPQRLADLHFNAVRLWETSRAPIKDYVKGDNSLIDILDHFLAALRARGIGVYCTKLNVNPGASVRDSAILSGPDIIEAPEADHRAWIEAIKSQADIPRGQGAVGVLYFDERLQELQRRRAAAFLNHVNHYTGLRNADENNFIFWDLVNEDGFIWDIVSPPPSRASEDRLAVWPPYFRKNLDRHFSAWLKDRYASNQKVAEAWGGMGKNESVDSMNVDANRMDRKGKPYSRARITDFTAFMVDRVSAFYAGYEKFIRSHASKPDRAVAVSGFNYNTAMLPHIAEFAKNWPGTFLAAGCYQTCAAHGAGGSNWKGTPRYPLDLNIHRAYHAKDIHFLRPAGKPVVCYEINEINGFNPYRSDYPWVIATAAAWQNYSGIFFYCFFELETPEALFERRAAHGFYLANEEVFVSAMSAAGYAYVNYLLPTAQKPTVVTYSARTAADPVWRRFSFEPEIRGYAGAAPPRLSGLSVAQASDLFSLLRVTAFVRGERIAISNDTSFDVRVSGPLDPLPSDATVVPWNDWDEKDKLLFNTSLDQKNGVVWDWKNGRIRVDRDKVKAIIGFLEKTSYAWKDGFAVSGLDEPFLAISCISHDGKPLAKSTHFRLNPIGSAYNEGMWTRVRGLSDARGIVDPNWQRGREFKETGTDGLELVNGTGPLVIRRLNMRLRMPHLPGRMAYVRNWKLDTIATIKADSVLQLTDKQEVFDVILRKR